jgi:RNA polymerase sigma factor (sigma-70 family)
VSLKDLFNLWRAERSARARAQLVEAAGPLVYSICRRHLLRPDDVEDAAQETLLKLTRDINSVRGDITAWIASAAAKTSIDFIRRAVRERSRRERLLPGAFDTAAPFDRIAVERALVEALQMLNEETRQLIVDRFFRQIPLRVIAGQKRTSVASISRQTTAAVADLAGAIRQLGMNAIDDAAISEYFGTRLGSSSHDDGLRFSPDWRALHWPLSDPIGAGAPFRRIRVGMFVGLASSFVTTRLGRPLRIETQVRSSRLLVDPRIELVGIVEPGSPDKGIVECTIREHEITAGLMLGTDAAALQTLDVIILGVNSRLAVRVAEALANAVRSGVGLINEFWTHQEHQVHPAMRDLALAKSRVHAYHMPPVCGLPLPATVCGTHPLLPELKIGQHLSVTGCGPLYVPQDNAKVLITKDRWVPPADHTVPGAGALQMPVLLVGELGRGRIAVINTWTHQQIAHSLGLSAETWLMHFIE